jgi:F-type H+-transporting ATPase subunit b
MAAATMIEGTESTKAPAGEAGLPQFNPEHFASQIFWLAVIFGLLFILLSRVTLPKIAGGLMARKSRIEGDLSAAEQSKKDASDALAAYEAALAQARSKALTHADENRKRVVAEIDSLKSAADAKALEAMSKAEARIAAERTKAEGNIRSAAAEAAASIVERLIGAPVGSDEAARAVDGIKAQKA